MVKGEFPQQPDTMRVVSLPEDDRRAEVARKHLQHSWVGGHWVMAETYKKVVLAQKVSQVSNVVPPLMVLVGMVWLLVVALRFDG